MNEQLWGNGDPRYLDLSQPRKVGRGATSDVIEQGWQRDAISHFCGTNPQLDLDRLPEGDVCLSKDVRVR